jgi:hypothetical protein
VRDRLQVRARSLWPTPSRSFHPYVEGLKRLLRLARGDAGERFELRLGDGMQSEENLDERVTLKRS